MERTWGAEGENATGTGKTYNQSGHRKLGLLLRLSISSEVMPSGSSQALQQGLTDRAGSLVVRRFLSPRAILSTVENSAALVPSSSSSSQVQVHVRYTPVVRLGHDRAEVEVRPVGVPVGDYSLALTLDEGGHYFRPPLARSHWAFTSYPQTVTLSTPAPDVLDRQVALASPGAIEIEGLSLGAFSPLDIVALTVKWAVVYDGTA